MRNPKDRGYTMSKTFKPPQVTLLQAAEGLLTVLEMRELGIPLDIYGEADVLRQAIQREKAK